MLFIMSRRCRPWFAAVAALLLVSVQSAFAHTTKTVIAEAQYVMADGDTLASAEEKVMQRAQRKALEEAGVYLESTFYDLEKESQGWTTRNTSWEIRTITAAITETEVLDSRRSFENARPVFFIRIRAGVDMQHLADAIRRLQSEAQLARHFRELQQENQHLRAQLREFQQEPPGVRMLTIEPSGKPEPVIRAKQQLETAFQTPDLWKKIQLASDAAQLDPHSAEPLIVRGQAYLRLVSIAYSEGSHASGYSDQIEKARSDFDQAVEVDAKNPWAWIGKGDVQTWLKRMDEAAFCYERALALDPFFDIARQRLIGLYTTQARRQAKAKQWHQSLGTLKKLLDAQTPESWLPDKKEAYLLRSDVLLRLHRPEQALEDLSMVIKLDPTNVRALLTRANLYRDRLQGRLAKEDFEQACVLGSIEACEQLP
jgi:tetratricopeptide (TPR) repeat protein